MLNLKLQYFGHLMQSAVSFEKTLMLGKIEGRKRRGWQSMRWLDGITDSMDMSLGKTPGVGDGQGGLVCCRSWGQKIRTRLSNWTELNWIEYSFVYMYHNFFIHSSVDGHLGCFHVLAIVNTAAMINGIHMSFSILVSSGYMPRSGIAGSFGGTISSFF